MGAQRGLDMSFFAEHSPASNVLFYSILQFNTRPTSVIACFTLFCVAILVRSRNKFQLGFLFLELIVNVPFLILK